MKYKQVKSFREGRDVYTKTRTDGLKWFMWCYWCGHCIFQDVNWVNTDQNLWNWNSVWRSTVTTDTDVQQTLC